MPTDFKLRKRLATIDHFCDENSMFTPGQIRGWIFNMKFNGLADSGAIIKTPKRIYIDVDAFEKWLLSRDEKKYRAR